MVDAAQAGTSIHGGKRYFWRRAVAGSLAGAALVALGTASGSAALATIGPPIVPNVSIGPVMVGAKVTIAALKKALGAHVSASASGDEVRQVQPGGLLIVRLYRGQIVEVETSSAAFITAGTGIHVGSTASAVAAAYHGIRSTGESYYLIGSAQVLGEKVHTYFDLRGAKVVSIRVGFSPWLTPCYGGPTHVADNVSGTVTWGLRGCPYVLNNSVSVDQGATLTIKPGVVIKGADAGSGLEAKGGAIIAQGTADAPIVFTSLTDQNHGALSTGSQAGPKPGDWGGLSADSGAVLRLSHVQVYYAGSNAGNRGDAALVIGHDNNPQVTVQDSAFGYNANYGIDAGDAAPTTRIQRTAFFGNDMPLAISGGMNLDNSNIFNPAGLSRNKKNGVFLGSGQETTIAENNARVTWSQNRVPFVIQSATVGANSTLVVGPGVVIKGLDTGSKLKVDGGALQLNGTATQPVVLTSFADDAHGGDTNGDGSLSRPQSGGWVGLVVSTQGAALSMKHGQLWYAGSGAGNAGSGGLTLSGDISQNITIEDSLFADNATFAIDAGTAPASTKIARTTFYGNDKPLQVGAGVNIDNSSTFHGPTPNKSNAIFLVTNGSFDLKQGTQTYLATEIPFVVDGNLQVEQGATLVLGPGVVLKGVNGGAVEIKDGTLNVNGTASAPVIMTSLSDDKHGTAFSTGNGAAAGDWDGLSISGSAKATISHLKIFYTGKNSGNDTSVPTAIIVGDTAAVSIDSSEIAFGAGDAITNGSTHQLSVTNTSIHDMAGYAFNYVGDTDANNVPKSVATTTQSGNTLASNKGPIAYSDAVPGS